MKRWISTFLLLVLCGSSRAVDLTYSAGGGVSQAWLMGGNFFDFESETGFTAALGYRLSDYWQLRLDFSRHVFSNKTGVDTTGSAGMLRNNEPFDLELMKLGISANTSLLEPSSPFNFLVGAGGGLMIWKGTDPVTDQTLTVAGSQGEPTGFSAEELVLSAYTGISVSPARTVSLQILGQVDYLTGAGTNLADDLASARDRVLVGANALLTVNFGSTGGTPWRSERSWQQAPATSAGPVRNLSDSDADGVPDELDDCLNTPRNVAVDGRGCALDSDDDGVADGLDDCPDSPAEAAGHVDIHGCPIDSDFDGIPDFRDRCPYNADGAWVDSGGCPIDADGDGVADGLDDCPNTLTGVAVDAHGCIDLNMFAEPMVLNIDYASGSFEVDPHTLERLKKLAGILNFVSEIKLDVYGYTDDIGTAVANRNLSEKRARRVRDYLIAYGIEADRIKVFGRGEADFVASNETAQGRAKNRRIEIVFYR